MYLHNKNIFYFISIFKNNLKNKIVYTYFDIERVIMTTIGFIVVYYF